MFCSTCGEQLPDGAGFCSSCGSAVNASPVSQQSNSNSGRVSGGTSPLITVDVEGIKQKAQEVGRGVADNARATAGEVGSKVSFSPSKGFPMLVAGIVVFVVCSIIQGIFGSSMFDRSYSPSQAGIVGAILLNITFWPGWLLTIGCLLGGLRAMFKSTESEKNELMKEAETARIQGDISKAEELEARARNVK